MVGHDLLAVEPAVLAHRLAKARQVAQRRVEAAAPRFGADAVDRVMRVVLRAEARPQQVGGERREALPAEFCTSILDSLKR